MSIFKRRSIGVIIFSVLFVLWGSARIPSFFKVEFKTQEVREEQVYDLIKDMLNDRGHLDIDPVSRNQLEQLAYEKMDIPKERIEKLLASLYPLIISHIFQILYLLTNILSIVVGVGLWLKYPVVRKMVILQLSLRLCYIALYIFLAFRGFRWAFVLQDMYVPLPTFEHGWRHMYSWSIPILYCLFGIHFFMRPKIKAQFT